MSDGKCENPACAKAFGHKSVPVTCHQCKTVVHSNCAKQLRYQTARFSDGVTGKICETCYRQRGATVTIIPRNRNDSTSSTVSINEFDPLRSNTPDSGTSALDDRPLSGLSISTSSGSYPAAPSPIPPTTGGNDQVIQQLQSLTATVTKLMEQMVALRTSTDDSFRSVNDQFKALNTTVAPIEQLPLMVQCIDKMEEEMKTMKRDHQNLRELVTEQNKRITATNNTTPIDPELAAKIKNLEEVNKQLSAKINKAHKTAKHQPTDSCYSVIISGLNYGNATDFVKISYSVLKVLRPSIQEHDIDSVRQLLPRNRNIISSTTTIAPAQNGAASLAADQSSSTGTTKKSTSPSLLVTFLSPMLVKSIIRAKIAKKKLHSSEIDTNLLIGTGCNQPLPATLININEFLEGEVWELKKEVLNKSRTPGAKFFFHTRDGQIYVKKRKDDQPILLTSKEDLQAFLSATPPS